MAATSAYMVAMRQNQRLYVKLFRNKISNSDTPALLCNRTAKPSLSYRNYHHFNKLQKTQVVNKSLKGMLASGKFVQRFQPIQLMCSSSKEGMSARTISYYSLALIITMGGLSYVCAPLYKKFCQQVGLGGKAEAAGHDLSKVKDMKPVRDRVITVQFNADKHATMQWNFRPTQREIKVVPGETALAFFRARNPTEQPIIGVSTYNVLPYRAALYFNKIQCFCFEEQRLNPHEEVDLPVFFYIDPEYDNDPQLLYEDKIVLSYTFFEAKAGMELPTPEWVQELNKQNEATTPQSSA